MKEYKFCDLCDKNDRSFLRRGEGYIVLSKSNGKENTKKCSRCKGEGYLFIREYDPMNELVKGFTNAMVNQLDQEMEEILKNES